MKGFLLSGLILLFSSAVLAGESFQLNRGISGSWYNPAQDGHGFSMEYLDDSSLLVYWYTYTPAGDPAFLLGIGSIEGNQVTVPMLFSQGMVFGVFDPDTRVLEDWGTITISFDSCTSGNVSYESTYTLNEASFGSGSFPISRLAFVQNLTCENANVAPGLPVSPIAGFFEGAVEAFTGVAVVFEDGSTWINVPTFGLLRGDLSVAGGMASGTLSAKSELGFPLGDINVDVEYVARDWLRGSFDDLGGGSFTLGYRTLFERDSTVAGFAGSYRQEKEDGSSLSLTVNADGSVSGSNSDGCSYQGQISLLDANFNPAAMTLTVSDCAQLTGEHTGIAVLADLDEPGDSNLLYITLDSETTAILGTLPRTPEAR
ncbi:MAG: hypothetical protein QNJ40_16980 [Xanthomonadales bacterium]|nr:hypothetical protein [Xanthomonadales bacterium]